jgi:serine/threonine-protein kinase
MGVTAERDDPRLGVVLRDRYRIEGVIGSGGMATVYLAVHRNGNRVALKMLHPQLSGPGIHRERFVRESYVANSLDHPGTVRVLDDDVSEDGCPFLVMELLHGETLEARYRRLGRLDPREVLALGHALCDVLVRAHALGVVHRDLKPDNIFLTGRGELKVLDFGIAQVRQDGRSSGTRTGHLMGTPAYMPPEQALGRRHAIDGRTDLWSLGATLFALLAGRSVHHADTPEESVVRSATEPAPPLASVAPDVPAPIAAVVDRALAFAPEQRWPDAAAMQTALAAAHREVYGAGIDTAQLPRGPSSTVTQPIRPPGAVATFAAATLASDPGRALTVSGAEHTLAGDEDEDEDEDADADDERDEHDPDPFAEGRARARPHPAPAPAPDDIHTVVDAPLPPALAASPPPITRPQPAASRRRRRTLAALAGLAALGVAAAFAAGARDGGDACTSNAACAGDAPAICRKDLGRCVPLLTDGCRLIAEPEAVARDDTFWFGAMYPERETSSTFGAEAVRWVELAHRDFTGLVGGLPSARPGVRPRPIGVILCDDTADHERLAAHLVDGVGVPAVIGFGRSKEVLELATTHFVPRGVLALASNTAAMLSSIPHPPGEVRLVQRMTTSAAMISPPKCALIRGVLEPRLRAGPLAAGSLRIAVVGTANASGTSHTDAFHSALVASRPAGAREELRQFLLPDSSTADPASIVQPTADIVAWSPHIILDAGAPQILLPALERGFVGEARPLYIYGGVDREALHAAAAVHPDFHARFHQIGTRDNPALDKANAHYLATWGGDADGLSPTPYDAFYVVAYAAIAAGDGPVDGRTLARAIRRLVGPGAPVEIGPAGIYPALKVLAAGGSVDLRGTLTDLDFDPETGDASADFGLSCIDPTDHKLHQTGARYDPTRDTFTGPAGCR